TVIRVPLRDWAQDTATDLHHQLAYVAGKDGALVIDMRPPYTGKVSAPERLLGEMALPSPTTVALASAGAGYIGWNSEVGLAWLARAEEYPFVVVETPSFRVGFPRKLVGAGVEFDAVEVTVDGAPAVQLFPADFDYGDAEGWVMYV